MEIINYTNFNENNNENFDCIYTFSSHGTTYYVSDEKDVLGMCELYLNDHGIDYKDLKISKIYGNVSGFSVSYFDVFSEFGESIRIEKIYDSKKRIKKLKSSKFKL